MRKCKRLLSVTTSLLILVSSFALPYGVTAEEVGQPSVEQGQVAATFQGDTPAVAQQGNDQWVGKSFSLATPYVFDKAAKNYLITLEVMVHQDYGFTDPAWMLKCLGDGNLVVKASDNTEKVNPISYTQMLQTAGALVEDEWMKVQIPLSEFAGADIEKLEFNTYVHACKWDPVNYPTDSSKCKNGCRISYRNVVVRDMSRTAQGGLSETVAVFGAQDVEYVSSHEATGGAKAIVPNTNVAYNLITADMALADLNVEFDVMYEGDGNLAPGEIKNGEVRLYSGNTEHKGKSGWSNSIIKKEGVWYHVSLPLSDFTGGNALTDPTAITRIYAFNYNDKLQAFTAKAKNMKITYAPAVNLKAELEKAKNYYVYDVDDNAVAYETAVNNARGLFTNADATYADFKTALTEVQTAKTALTNFRELSYEVVRYTQQEYTKTETLYGNNKQLWYDWKSWDGMGSVGVDLRDDPNGDITQIGSHRYFQTTVTLEPNTAWTGDPLTTLDILDRVEYRVRTNDGSEKRTNSYTMSVISKEVTDQKAVYVMEGLIDDSQRNQAEWDDIRQSIIWPYLKVNSDGNKVSPVACTLSNVRIVNKTAEKIGEELAQNAQETLPAGKYTAASTEAYLALQADAKVMVNNADATLQQKTQLIKQMNAAKEQFVAVMPEYVQFGKPDTVADSYHNVGTEGKHSMNRTLNVTQNAITGSEDFSKLQLRMEIMVTRDDGRLDVTNAIVNGNLTFKGAVDMQKGFGKDSKSLLGNATAGVWNTVYLNLSDFTNCTAESDLSQITKLVMFAYNDLRGGTDNPGINVQIRNVAIVDGSNSDVLGRLAAAFVDVTEGGKKDFTPDSLAAYQAVYDEWYPVYESVDIDRAEEAIAAMAEAKKLLVCVDHEVMSFGGFSKAYKKGNDATNQFYADWTRADQGLVDISDRNIENLRIRFDLTITAADTVTEPLTTLTIKDHRLAVRHNATGEPGFNYQGSGIITTMTVGETVHVDWALSDMTDKRNGDNLLENIIFWMVVNELSGVPVDDYTMTIANARVVDVTKETMLAELTKAANATLTEMGDADGVVYDETSADALKAAQTAAKEVLVLENPTYAQLANAQKAIDDAKAGLKAIGHTVLSFGKIETGTANNWIGKNGTKVTPTDLSKYDYSKLSLRFNMRLMAEDGSIVPPENTAVYVKNAYFTLRAYDENNVETNLAAKEKSFKIGDTVFDIPLSTMSAWGKDNLDMTRVSQLDLTGYVKENVGGAGDTAAVTQKYKFVADNVCIVDTTAEDNLGSVQAVGNGRIDITGDLVYGGTDTLTATTTSSNSTFVGWNVNASFNREDSVTLPVSGSEQVSAYYVNADETAVIYYGKYNKVLGVQVVKAAEELTAPAIPDIYGYKAAGWDTPAEGMEALVESGRGGTAAVTAVYEADAGQTLYTITLTNAQRTNGSETENLMFDTRIEVKAMPVEGQQFSHWELDGMAVGYEETYSFYVSGNNALTAVYTSGEAAKPVLAVGIKQTMLKEDAASGTYTISMIGQTYIPAGNTVLEYGLIYAPNEAIIGNLGSYEAGRDYLKIVSSSRMANRQYIIHLTNVKPNRTRYGMAYVTVKHADGSVETLYSTVKSMTTPAAVPAA